VKSSRWHAGGKSGMFRKPVTLSGVALALLRRSQRVVHPYRIGIVGAWITLLAGCAAAPTWRDHAVLSSQALSAPGTAHSAEFDPKTACEAVVKAHNRLRAEAKLPSLAANRKLQAAALLHAKDMAARNKMTHKGSDGSSVVDRITDEGYRYRRAGENIAAGRFNVDRLMNGWMDSPPHKRNILGTFSHIGVAYATAEDGTRYWCVTFGLPARR
jgi:uncharacterized protein YkwD